MTFWWFLSRNNTSLPPKLELPCLQLFSRDIYWTGILFRCVFAVLLISFVQSQCPWRKLIDGLSWEQTRWDMLSFGHTPFHLRFFVVVDTFVIDILRLQPYMHCLLVYLVFMVLVFWVYIFCVPSLSQSFNLPSSDLNFVSFVAAWVPLVAQSSILTPLFIDRHTFFFHSFYCLPESLSSFPHRGKSKKTRLSMLFRSLLSTLASVIYGNYPSFGGHPSSGLLLGDGEQMLFSRRQDGKMVRGSVGEPTLCVCGGGGHRTSTLRRRILNLQP